MRTLLVALAIAAAVWLIAIGALLLAGRRSAARELTTLVPNLLALFRGLLQDDRVPRGARFVLVLSAAWIASPIDLIPEFIPVAGPLDDAIVAALALRYVLRRAGRDTVTQHWPGDPATLDRILRLAGVPGDAGGGGGGGDAGG